MIIVTPKNTVETNLLMSLFKKMKVKAIVHDDSSEEEEDILFGKIMAESLKEKKFVSKATILKNLK